MQAKEQEYLLDYIDNLLRDDYNNLVVLIHSNSLRFTKEDVASMDLDEYGYKTYYCEFKSEQMRTAYEPFLGIIKDYVHEKILENAGFDLENFMNETGVYELHKSIFRNYFYGERIERKEDLIMGEYQFEQNKFRESIVRMLKMISLSGKPIFIIINGVNSGGLSTWKIIEEFTKKDGLKNIKLFAVYDETGETLDSTVSIRKSILKECGERDISFDWFLDNVADNFSCSVNGKNKQKEDIHEQITKLLNMSYFLDYEMAIAYLRDLVDEKENKQIAASFSDKVDLIKIYFWASMGVEDYPYALVLCDRLERLAVEENKKEELQFDIIYFKTMVYMYAKNEVQMKDSLELCKVLARNSKKEEHMFRVELLSVMTEYFGWKDIRITEKDVRITEDFIRKCVKYGAMNHLAHIFVYCYDNRYKDLEKIQGIEERNPNFMRGVEIAREIKNEQFLIEAYNKLIMLASIHSYYDVAIYFYQKVLEVVREQKNEVQEAGIYNGFGYSNCGLGCYEEANKYYNKALCLYYSHGKIDEVVETLYNLGINALIAEDYENASRYLLEAGNILHSLKQSTIKTCNIAKLFGLIALACFRHGIFHRAYLYLNNAKQFLNHLLGEGHTQEEMYCDDSIFLYYFVSALIVKKEGDYETAYLYLKKSEFYMKRSTGSTFFNYPQYAEEFLKVCRKIGHEEEGEAVAIACLKYCEKQQYRLKAQKLRLLLGECIEEEERVQKYNLGLTGITLGEITDWIQKEAFEKESMEIADNMRFLRLLQRFTNNMSSDIITELNNIVPIFKSNFCVDKTVLIDCKDGCYEILYSDFAYEITEQDIEGMVTFFLEKKSGIVFTKNGQEYEEYNRVFNVFNKDRIFSFIAVPNMVEGHVHGIMISYVEQRVSWTSSKERTILDQNDLGMFSYIYKQIMDAIERVSVNERLLEANNQLKNQIEQVTRLKNEAEKASEAKSNFLANMSHEIRTPMNAIIGMTEIAMRESMSSKQKESLEQIRSAGNNLLSIINDILDFSKIESGKMEIRESDYQIKNVVQDVKNILTSRIGEKGIRLKIMVNEDIPNYLYGDDLRLRQIIINLGNNAIKFTEQGAVTIEMDYEKKSEDKILLYVSIKDTGIGIKDEDLEKLFGAFQQVDGKRNRRIEGTGLGLSISKAFVELMNGEIGVRSEYGKGSDFFFQIEQKISKISDTKAGAIEKNSAEEFMAECARIMVVDDNIVNLKVIEGLLEPFKMKLVTVLSGRKCIEILEKDQEFDLIFMDQMMPVMDGIETLEEIRKLEGDYYQNVPVIALTANAISGVHEMFFECGFQDYLSKPIDMKEMRAVLLRWLPQEKIKAVSKINKEDVSLQDKIKKDIKELINALDEFDITKVEEMMQKLEKNGADELFGNQMKDLKKYVSDMGYMEAIELVKKLLNSHGLHV